MDEDGPNFSYAYGGAPSNPSTPSTPSLPSNTSWNPALRSENGAGVPASAKPATQPEQPKPDSSEEEDDEDEEADDDDEESEDESEEEDEAPPKPAVAAPVITEPANKPEIEEESSSDESPERNDTIQSPPRAQPPQTKEPLEFGNDAAPEDDLVNATQALDIGEPQATPAKAESSDEEGSEEEESEEESSEEEAEPEQHAEENYEHQGETTALEDAMAESVKVPLVEDTEADEWGGSGDEIGRAHV